MASLETKGITARKWGKIVIGLRSGRQCFTRSPTDQDLNNIMFFVLPGSRDIHNP